MQVARLHGKHDIRLHDAGVPRARPGGWSLVRVESVGVCGTDLLWFSHGAVGGYPLEQPLTPGHEMSGIALDGPLAGYRVAVDPVLPCGWCERCRTGEANLCPRVRFAGQPGTEGGCRSEILWPDHLLHPLPAGISADAGALLEPVGVAIHAVELAHLRPGHDVLVVGGGPIGILVAELALLRGAQRVFVSEPLPHRREAALARGATAAWHPDEVDAALAEETGGRGVDVVVEMAGDAAAIDTSVAAARHGGRVVLGGIPGDDRVSFSVVEGVRKGLTIAMVGGLHATWTTAIGLTASGRIDLDSLVTHRFPLTRVHDAFVAAEERRGLRVVIDVDAAAG